LTERLLKFDRMRTWLDRTDWIYAISGDQYLTEPERLLGIQIINHLHLQNQECRPDQLMLAARLGVSPRTVVRRVGIIERAGWLNVKRVKGAAGKLGRPGNQYLPTIPKFLRDQIQVTPNCHLDTETQLTNRTDPSDTKTPTQVTPRWRANKEGIGNNNKERGFAEEMKMKDDPILPGREFFVEVDSPEWEAWSKLRHWPPRDCRINGRIKRGWWFRSAWPSSELKPKLNGGSAPISEAAE
jgi:hypothetical protein